MITNNKTSQPSPHITTRQTPRAPLNRLAECLELSDKDFSRMICAMESDPVFKRMYYPPYAEDTIITMKRFDFSDLFPGFHRIIKPSIEKQRIDQIGREQFTNYFVYNDSHLLPEQIAANSGISIDDVCALQGMVSHAYIPSGKIAEIAYRSFLTPSGEEDERVVISFFSPSMARGVYAVDYARLSARKDALYAEFEKDHIRRIIRLIELINLRKTIVYKILICLIKVQDAFFRTGDYLTRKILNQKTIAGELCVDKSIVSRTVHNRSVVVKGQTVFLKDLCMNQKKIILQLMEKIIADERTILSDEIIRKRLTSKYRIHISRRSITAYRKQMTIPSSFKRVKQTCVHR